MSGIKQLLPLIISPFSLSFYLIRVPAPRSGLGSRLQLRPGDPGTEGGERGRTRPRVRVWRRGAGAEPEGRRPGQLGRAAPRQPLGTPGRRERQKAPPQGCAPPACRVPANLGWHCKTAPSAARNLAVPGNWSHSCLGRNTERPSSPAPLPPRRNRVETPVARSRSCFDLSSLLLSLRLLTENGVSLLCVIIHY